MSRGGADDGPPAPVLEWLGRRGEPDAAPAALGHGGRSWVVAVGGERLVVKRLGGERAIDDYVPLFNHVARLGIGPRFVGAIPGTDGWYAVFEFVPGRQPPAAHPDWDLVWRQVPAILALLRSPAALPAFDLLDHWRAVLAPYRFPDGAGRQLQELLFADEPDGQPVVAAHGDFSPQNFILAGADVMLIDWEEAGRAPIGFDPGWAIAVVEAGAAPGGDTSALLARLRRSAPDQAALRWFVRLGFLRMLWRAQTLPLTELVRAAIVARLGVTIARDLAGGTTG